MGNSNSRTAVSVDTYLESNLESVDQAEESVIGVAQQMGFPEEEVYRVGMAVREAMVNAVVHGNRYNANKRVRLEVLKRDGDLIIKITDEGIGFRPEEQPDPLAEENLLRQSGRGMMLIRAFVDEFVVQPAKAGGTEAIIRKTVPTPEDVSDL